MINNFFASIINSNRSPISVNHTHNDGIVLDEYIIFIEQVYEVLTSLKPHTSLGPDELPTWVLKDFASFLAPPKANMSTASVRQMLVPPIWKSAYISPIPKISPPYSIENDIRLISLTAILAKSMETFIYGWLIKSVAHLIDTEQFGGLKGSSTVCALVDLIHFIVNATDSS